MKNRSLSAIFISLCFVMLISIPLISSLLTRDEEMSKAEKRRLAPLPELAFSKTSFQKFPTEFEKYYNDHFGFRSQIVKLHNYAICSIFKVSPSTAVTVGKEDWYFFNSGAIHDYFGLTKFSQHKLAKFAQVLKDREAWLDSLGIRYLFIPVPNKSSVYGEYLPRRVTRSAGSSKYEQITSYLKNSSDFDHWLDTYKILTDKKEDLQVYFRTDSHWNHDGVYFVYRELIERLAKWLPELSPIAMKKEKKWVKDYSGDLVILMNLRGIITEKAPAENIQRKCKPRALKRLDWMQQWNQYKDVQKNRLPVENGCDENQYTALIIHDSFGRFLRPLLSQHFKKIIYVNFFNFELIKPLIQHEMVDVVMDLRVSRNLQKALIFDEELEQTVLKTKFSQLPTTLMKFDQNSWTTFIDGDIYAAYPEPEDFFPLTTTKDKPFLPLTFDEKRGDGPIVIEIDISSEQPTDLAIFFLTKGIGQSTEMQMEKRLMAAGRQKIYFRILQPGTIGRIRVQPATAGKYKIYSITAKREDTISPPPAH